MKPWIGHLAALVAIGTLVACGGGAEDASPATATSLGAAAGGALVSDDGKLSLFVAPGAADADVTASLVKVAPAAGAASTPGLVPESRYAYVGTGVDFNPPAVWELESPRATDAGADDRKSALLAVRATDIDVERLCQASYARGKGRAPTNVWVAGDACPVGCAKQRSSNPATRNARSFCASEPELRTIPRGETCPIGSRDVSDEAEWGTLAAERGVRLCDSVPSLGAPVLGAGVPASTSSCVRQNGRFGCSVPTTRGATIDGWVIEGDTEPPTDVRHGFRYGGQPHISENRSGPGYLVEMQEGGGQDLGFAPSAVDAAANDYGLYSVSLYEYVGLDQLANGQAAVIQRKLWWTAPPASTMGLDALVGLAGAPSYQAPCCAAVPYVAGSGPSARYFYAEASDIFGNTRRSSIVRIGRVIAATPTIASFAANPIVLPPGGGAAVLSWQVQGATSVNILPSLGNVGTLSGSAPVVVAGSTVFTLTATNAFGQTATRSLPVAVLQDTTPPAVTLASSSASVVVPATVTLTASATDGTGVAKVEFYRGATLIATDTTAPYQHSVAFTAADVGLVSFTARAYDTVGNVATSTPVVVGVTDPPGNGDTWVAPGGSDVANPTCAQATPCRTIAKAASLAQPNKTVWLLDGDYTAATQPVPILVPPARTLRAVHPRLARVGQQIVMQGSGSIVGVALRRQGFGDWGSIAASAGTVALDGVKATGSSAVSGSYPPVLVLSGTVHATMTPGGIADYADELTPATQSVAIYGLLSDTARLTVAGGVFGGAALGGSDGVSGAANRGAFNLTGSSRLDLDAVTLNVESSGIFLYGDATEVRMTGSTLRASANVGPGYGIHAAKGTPTIALVNSSITGFASAYHHSSVGVAVGLFAQPGVQATLSLVDSTIGGNDVGVHVSEQGTTPSSISLTGVRAVVADNRHGGIVCRDACSVDLLASQVRGNATSDPSANVFPFSGGIWMGLSNRAYFLKLRETLVVDNRSTAGSNSASADNSGVTIAGNASSGFDLGHSSSPGNNVITGNTSSAQTTGLHVKVTPGITVRAIGNTFMPGVQGADAQGRYQLGTAPCGAASCAVTGGTGPNFRVTSGAVLLAAP